LLKQYNCLQNVCEMSRIWISWFIVRCSSVTIKQISLRLHFSHLKTEIRCQFHRKFWLVFQTCAISPKFIENILCIIQTVVFEIKFYRGTLRFSGSHTVRAQTYRFLRRNAPWASATGDHRNRPECSVLEINK